MKEGYFGHQQGKSKAPGRNHGEKNRIYLKRRGDHGSTLEHLWQGKSGLKYHEGQTKDTQEYPRE